ncbi:hypothetical protein GGI43DRAFT_414508 [Trichoderma evansii]
MLSPFSDLFVILSCALESKLQWCTKYSVQNLELLLLLPLLHDTFYEALQYLDIHCYSANNLAWHNYHRDI